MAATGLVIYLILDETPSMATECPPSSTPTDGGGQPLPAGDPPLATATLERVEGQTSTLRFGRSVDVRYRSVAYNLTDNADAVADGATLGTVVQRFVRDDDHALVGPPKGPLITATAVNTRDVVVLDLCVDREGEAIVAEAGTYNGTVSILDPRVNRVDVPFTLVFSFPYWPRVLLLLCLAIPPAYGYTWLLKETGKGRSHPNGRDAATDRDDGSLRWGDFLDWGYQRTGILALGSGIVAAFVAYSATYLATESWGSSVLHITSLYGAMFTAFVTAATAVTAGHSQQPQPAETTASGEESSTTESSATQQQPPA